MSYRFCLLTVLAINSNVVLADCDGSADVCLELQPAAATTAVTTAVSSTAKTTEGATEEVTATHVTTSTTNSGSAGLVDGITTDLKSRRLTRPPGNNALEKILKLKKIKPDHDYAINGQRYVARIYLSMARVDLKNNLLARARARLNAASDVYPSLPGLSAVAAQMEAGSSEPETGDVTVSSNTRKEARAGVPVDNTAKNTASVPAGNADAKSVESSGVKAVDNAAAKIAQGAGVLITPIMVGLPAGTFVMGSESGADNEKPAHQVNVNAFSMSRYEITREQFYAYKADEGTQAVQPELSEALVPVSGISSHEAIAYTRWLSVKTGKRYRLPTEAEWEYAVRAGTMTPYHSGDAIFGSANCLTCLDEIPRSAKPVGSFKPNDFGLYDMHGNVAEWTASCLTANYFANNERSESVCTKRIVRGGSWRSTREQVRSSFRIGQSSSGRSMDTGFRVVHDGL